MSMLTWEDATSYHRQKPRVQTAWETRVGPIRIYITRDHLYFRPHWAYIIQPLMHEACEMGAVSDDDVTAAQAFAVKMARQLLEPYVTAAQTIDGGDMP